MAYHKAEEHPEIEVVIHDSSDARYQFCPDVDAYIIATPSDTHFDIACTLIEQGKHVLVEKPVALTYSEATKLYQLAREYDVVFLGGHTERFNPIFRSALPDLYGQQILAFHRYATKDGQEENIIFDVMIHDLELWCYLENIQPHSEVELKETMHFQDGLTEIVLSHRNKATSFSAAYNQPDERRELIGQETTVNFLDVDDNPKDSLQGLHSHFIKLCRQNRFTDRAWSAVAAVGLAEQIQRELFGPTLEEETLEKLRKSHG